MRSKIINETIDANGYSSYLEIGVRRKSDCFDEIKCGRKVSVDPGDQDQYDFKMTSDEFFAINESMFDMIFVDGLHTAEQCEKDILNSLRFLQSGGTIAVHDTDPPTEFHALEKYYYVKDNPRANMAWNGTVWKAIFRLRSTRDDLVFRTFRQDWGVTLITRGKGRLLTLENPYFSFQVFDKNRDEVLNTFPEK